MELLYPINFKIQPTDSLETLYSYIEQIEELIINKTLTLESNLFYENKNFTEIPDKIDEFSIIKTTTINETMNISDIHDINDIPGLEEIFDEDFLLDMEEEIFYQIDEYEIKTIFHIDEVLKTKITETVTASILLSIELIHDNDTDSDNDEIEFLDETEITEFVKERVNIYFEYIFPNIHSSPPIPKSVKITEFDKYQPIKTEDEILLLQQKIEFLKSQYQPEQRTPEWYEFRNGIMTASNIYKLLGTPAQYNSFICEKCNPVILPQQSYINTSGSRHWGQKYEKLSIQIYEKLYNTKVSEFGCIKHPEHEFIGASPDGIVTSSDGANHYGRMIEIKNIVNREITGVPLEAYWVQMQVQMEVCNLDICNFIETRFKECETIDEWKAVNKLKGIAISNIPILSIEYITPEYEFVVYDNPRNVNNSKNDLEEFIEKWKQKKVEIKWWYMDEFSCVVVPRNREWFKSVLSKLKEAWNIILHEKESGEYRHRLPKKKQNKTKCLIQLDNMDDNKESGFYCFSENEQKEVFGKMDVYNITESSIQPNENVKSFYIGNENTGLNRNTIVVKDI